jgi:4-oxalocrotonate tautomerase
MIAASVPDQCQTAPDLAGAGVRFMSECPIARNRAARRFAPRGKNALPCRSQLQEVFMPEVVFYALSGRSVEQKRALIKDFTDAVVKNYKVDPSAVTITIVESAREDKAKGGVLFSDMPPAKP